MPRLFVAILVFCLPATLGAQPTPLGEEFQVNTYTTGYLRSTAVAMNASGDFVVVWDNSASPGTDTDGVAVLGRRFSSDGSPIADEFQINTVTGDNQTTPEVAMNASGAFVVVWNSYNEVGDMSSGIRAQPYAADGSPIGSQIMVNTNTTQGQLRAKVLMEDDGEFVVAWIDEYYTGAESSTEFRRYASDGTPVGGIILVSSNSGGFISNTDIAQQPDGGSMVVWEVEALAGDVDTTRSIQGQLFDSAGAKIGGKFRVNSYTTGNQRAPRVEVGGDGDFVVVWESNGSAADDVDSYSIQARRFGSDGTALGDDMQVNTYTTAAQRRPVIAPGADGEFLVVWSDDGTLDGDRSVQAAYFDSSGTPIGEQFQVNAYTTGSQGNHGVASDGEGRFVVSWASAGSTGTDTDATSPQARRFVNVDITGQVFLDADFDGLRDPGEAPVEDVSVTLYDATDGTLLDATFTDSSGAYLFEDRVGEYFLEFEAPFQYVFTFQDRGSDDSVDSDVNPLDGRTEDFFSFEIDVMDAGVTNGVGDRVWLDVDGDGRQDGSEPGVEGVAVRLLEQDNGTEVAADIADPDGRYAFSDLSPGTYYLEFTAPAGFVFTSRDQGDDDTTDSDANPSTGETAGFVFASAALDLTWDVGLEADGDEDGVPDRVDNCPADANADQADADGDGTGDVCDVSSIGDRVWLDSNMNGIQDGGEAGFEAVTVELFSDTGVSQGTTLSAADGSYSFTGVAAGDYYLVFSEPTGFCYTSRDQGADDAIDSDVDPVTFRTPVLTLIPGGEDPTRDAGLVPDASVGNRVWLDDGNGIQDGGEPGVAGVTVTLFDDAGSQLDQTMTDADGFYVFAPGPGDYYLAFTLPADMTFAPRDRGPDDGADSDASPMTGTTTLLALGPGEVDASHDAGLEPAVIGNRVWQDRNADGRQQPDEPGFPGLTVHLLDEADVEVAQTTTDADGIYQFLGLATGSYRIEVVLPTDGVFSSQNVGGDTFESDLIDSDVDPATGRSELFEYTAGTANRRWDAGLRILPIFADGFESGDLTGWTSASP